MPCVLVELSIQDCGDGVRGGGVGGTGLWLKLFRGRALGTGLGARIGPGPGIFPPILHQTFSQQPAREVEAQLDRQSCGCRPGAFWKSQGELYPKGRENSSVHVHPTRFHDQSPSGTPTRPLAHSPTRPHSIPGPRSPNRQSLIPSEPSQRPSTEHSVPLEKRALPFVGPVLPSAVSRQNPRAPASPPGAETRRPAPLDDCFDQTPWTLQTNPVRSLLQGHPLDHSFSSFQGGRQAKQRNAQDAVRQLPTVPPFASSVFAQLPPTP